MTKRLFLVLGPVLVLVGCHKSPAERTQDAANPTALGHYGVATSFRVFSNELLTGGGAFLYPGGENQSLSFEDRTDAISQRSIRYSWNGQPTFPGDSGAYAGFTLIDKPTQAEYAANSTGRDLREAGYTRATFYARGSLSTNTLVKVEVADDTASGPIIPPCMTLNSPSNVVRSDCGAAEQGPQELTGNWRKYTIQFPNNSSLRNVKDFFKATIVYCFPTLGTCAPVAGEQPGQGGTVYFDQIQFEP